MDEHDRYYRDHAKAAAAEGQGGEMKTIEEWAALKKTEPVKLAAAKGLLGAPQGHELTEADYDQAINDAMNIRIG